MYCLNPKTNLRKGGISLENYLHFTDSQKKADLIVNHLNQIVGMHGFTKLRASKKVLTDAVNAIDLMSLPRSTLKENISSSASIKPEEVMSDLNELNWQECTVTSIQLINPLDKSCSDQHQPMLQNSDRPHTKSKAKKKYKSNSDVSSSSITETSKSNSVGASSGTEESAVKLKSNKRKKHTIKLLGC